MVAMRNTGLEIAWCRAESFAVANSARNDPTLGLKTSSSLWVQNTSTPTAFTLSRTETYGYDQYLDYLTSANYNDGLNNSSPTWSYDAAGSGTGSSPLDLDYLRQVQIRDGARHAWRANR
jgi:hypothetical protein